MIVNIIFKDDLLTKVECKEIRYEDNNLIFIDNLENGMEYKIYYDMNDIKYFEVMDDNI